MCGWAKKIIIVIIINVKITPNISPPLISLKLLLLLMMMMIMMTKTVMITVTMTQQQHHYNNVTTTTMTTTSTSVTTTNFVTYQNMSKILVQNLVLVDTCQFLAQWQTILPGLVT